MKKRILSVLMALCMVLSLAPTMAFAAAGDITVSKATYYNSGALKGMITDFNWYQGEAKGRLVLTSRYLDGQTSSEDKSWGAFSNFGWVYYLGYDEFSDVLAHDTTATADKKFEIISYGASDTDFEYSFGTPNHYELSFELNEKDIPLNKDGMYYVYLWVKYRDRYFPDNLICAIRVNNGAVEYVAAKGDNNLRNEYDSSAFTKVKSEDKYDVIVIAGANMTKTAESGNTTQSGLNVAMTPVVYTADEGYYFPEDYAVAAENGIMVRCDSASQITVYGTPSANATIELEAASVKPAPKYTVTVESDDNGTATASPTSAEAGATVTLTATPDEGYRFKEWQVVSGGVTITDNKFTMPGNAVEVKACFEAIPSTPPATPKLIFWANGGGGTMDDLTVYTTEDGGTVYVFELPACGFTPPVVGKQFAGWSMLGVDGVFPAGEIFRTRSLTNTLSAVWENASITPATYTVSFDANGGSGTKDDVTGVSGTYTLPAADTFTAPTGKLFDGWEVNGTKFEAGASITVSANTTVKALWKDASATPAPDTTPSRPSSKKPTYPAKVEEKADLENGAISFNKDRVRAGRTVTITVTPDAGYVLDKLVILNDDGKAVDFKDNGNGTYTFTMPVGGVEVEPFFVAAAPEKEPVTLVLFVDQVAYMLDGEPLVNDVAPVIKAERTTLPIRLVAETLGAKVDWSEADQTVTITKGDMTIVIYIGQGFALVNGDPVELDCPAYIANSRTYLPVRFVSENLGAEVTWGGADGSVTIVVE